MGIKTCSDFGLTCFDPASKPSLGRAAEPRPRTQAKTPGQETQPTTRGLVSRIHVLVLPGFTGQGASVEVVEMTPLAGLKLFFVFGSKMISRLMALKNGGRSG
jgi:hypothetical protein